MTIIPLLETSGSKSVTYSIKSSRQHNIIRWQFPWHSDVQTLIRLWIRLITHRHLELYSWMLSHMRTTRSHRTWRLCSNLTDRLLYVSSAHYRFWFWLTSVQDSACNAVLWWGWTDKHGCINQHCRTDLLHSTALFCTCPRHVWCPEFGSLDLH